MIKFILLAVGLFRAGICFAIEFHEKDEKQKHEIFIENKGQLTDTKGALCNDIKFLTDFNGAKVYFSTDGVYYVLEKTELLPSAVSLETTEKKKRGKFITRTKKVKMQLLGSNPNTEIVPMDVLPYYSNYYYSHNSQGITQVKQSKKILYKNVYPYIDMDFYFKDAHLEYDFIVYPGGNPASIQYTYKGINKIKTKNKSLHLENSLATLQEDLISVYGTDGNKRQEVPCFYKLDARLNIISYTLGIYNTKATLVIDPQLTLEWCTLFGGSAAEVVTGTGYAINSTITTDASNNVYFAGSTNSADFPVLDNSVAYHDGTKNGTDSFLAKFNSSGIQQWTTFYGGTGNEGSYSNCVTVDGAGNIYLAGTTSNADIPLLTASQYFDNTLSGASDLFIVKFNSTGVRTWATLYGGDEEESLKTHCVTTDGSNNLLLAINIGATGGEQYDGSDPGSGAYYFDIQPSQSGNMRILRFSSTTALTWGTSYNQGTSLFPYAIVTDASNNIYITGSAATGMAVTDDGTAYHDDSHNGGTVDAFLFKFNSAAVLQFATYLGGNGIDIGFDIDFSSTNDIFLVGESTSTSGFPLLNDGTATYDATYSGDGKAFIARFSSTTYREAMKQWHPDKFQQEDEQKTEAEEKSKLLIEAYHFLVSIAPETRAQALPEYIKTTTLSNIANINYTAQILEIEFLDGSKYQYFDVPKNLYIKLINADSQGRMARRHIYNNFLYRNIK